MKKLILSLALIPILFSNSIGQNCDKRTFVSNVSLDMAGFFVLAYWDDQLDSLYWDFGDGQTEWQTSNVGTGSANHTYANPGTYTVTLERWGTSGIIPNTTPVHCTYSHDVTIYPTFTDSICGAEFATFINGNTVTFSNQSIVQSPSFSTHPQHELWDFGDGQIGLYLNRVYEINYAPGTYTACLYYMGFSYNNGGYFFNCENCTTFTIGTSGINDLSSSDEISIYPNPASDRLTLKSSREIKNLRLLNVIGEQIGWITAIKSGKEMEMEIDDLTPGIYFLHMEIDDREVVKKFVKE